MHWVTLILLVFVVIAYILIGGAIFMALEKDADLQIRRIAQETFQSFLENNTCVTSADLEKFTKAVISAYDSGVVMPAKNTNTSNWNYASAIFFAVTVVTSIGYGHITPSTSSGQTFFMFYAIVGIPVCATMLIGIGERLSRPYKYLEKSKDFTRHHKTEKLMKMIAITLFCFVIFSIIPAAVIMKFEDWTFLGAWYYTIVTLTTVGFGDYVPGQQSRDNEEIYRIVTEVWIFCGLAWLAMVFHMAVHFVQLVTNKIDAATHSENSDDSKTENSSERDCLLSKEAGIQSYSAAQSETNSETIRGKR